MRTRPKGRSRRELGDSPRSFRRRVSGFPGFVPALAVLPVVLLACGPEGETGSQDAGSEPAGPQAEITAMLQASSASWNGGDLDGFLDDYWRSDELTFSGADGVTRGWEQVRERYLRTYWAPGASRDSLRFQEVEVTPLGSEHALALGRFVLYRPQEGDSVTASGYFSLVLRRTPEGWRIIHDHTSS